jgi:hypothetical protein
MTQIARREIVMLRRLVVVLTFLVVLAGPAASLGIAA